MLQGVFVAGCGSVNCGEFCTGGLATEGDEDVPRSDGRRLRAQNVDAATGGECVTVGDVDEGLTDDVVGGLADEKFEGVVDFGSLLLLVQAAILVAVEGEAAKS